MGGRSTTWSAWVGIYQYESQIIILWGVDLPTDLLQLSRVGIYQYESQIAIFRGGLDLPPGLPELSE